MARRRQNCRLNRRQAVATDAPAPDRMNEINQAMGKALPPIHGNRFNDGDYQALATTCQPESGPRRRDTANRTPGTMRYAAPGHRRLVAQRAEAMGRAGKPRHDGAVQVHAGLESYGKYFRHPGWKARPGLIRCLPLERAVRTSQRSASLRRHALAFGPSSSWSRPIFGMAKIAGTRVADVENRKPPAGVMAQDSVRPCPALAGRRAGSNNSRLAVWSGQAGSPARGGCPCIARRSVRRCRAFHPGGVAPSIRCGSLHVQPFGAASARRSASDLSMIAE